MLGIKTVFTIATALTQSIWVFARSMICELCRKAELNSDLRLSSAAMSEEELLLGFLSNWGFIHWDIKPVKPSLCLLVG